MKNTDSLLLKVLACVPDLEAVTLADIGGMGGLPLKWRGFGDRLKALLFEPDDREFEKIQSSEKVRTFNVALNNRSEELNFYISKEGGKSSIFEPNFDFLNQFENPARYETVAVHKIPAGRVSTLDSLLEKKEITDIDFIKLDTQGSEFRILEGGSDRALPLVFGAQIEVEFAELYRGQPLFSEVDTLMRKAGFFLVDIRRQFWKRKDFYAYAGKGQLVFGDALYFKDPDRLLQDLRLAADEYKKNKLWKGALVALLYGMFDIACQALARGVQAGLLDRGIANRMIEEIRAFPVDQADEEKPAGVKGLFRFLKGPGPAPYHWADSDQRIGNILDL